MGKPERSVIFNMPFALVLVALIIMLGDLWMVYVDLNRGAIITYPRISGAVHVAPCPSDND